MFRVKSSVMSVPVVKMSATEVLVLQLRQPCHVVHTGRGKEKALGCYRSWLTHISSSYANPQSLIATISLETINTSLILSFNPIYFSNPRSSTWQGNPATPCITAHIALCNSCHDSMAHLSSIAPTPPVCLLELVINHQQKFLISSTSFVNTPFTVKSQSLHFTS